MAAVRLKRLLDNNHIVYKRIFHPLAFSSLQLCEVCAIDTQSWAKVVICKAEREFFMVVLPADKQLALNLLGEMLHRPVTLATEQEFASIFPDCELGAMPPFGNLYDLEVFVSDTLTKDKMITFNAGNHSESYQIAWQDFNQLVEPKFFSNSR